MNGIHPRRECEFQLLRYVPDAVRNEYVHIGVILRERAAEDRPGQTEVRFTRDWRRVRCLDPDADTALLESMESELRRRLEHEPGSRLMRILEESLSLNVQMTEPKAYLAESMPAGMEELMRLYVEPPARERVARAERTRRHPVAHAHRVRARRSVGAFAQADCGLRVHAARRSAAHRCRLPAQWGSADVSRREPRRGS